MEVKTRNSFPGFFVKGFNNNCSVHDRDVIMARDFSYLQLFLAFLDHPGLQLNFSGNTRNLLVCRNSTLLIFHLWNSPKVERSTGRE